MHDSVGHAVDGSVGDSVDGSVRDVQGDRVDGSDAVLDAVRDSGRRVAAMGLVALAVGACAAPDAQPGWSGEVRDSAGVQIVLNRGAGLWGEAGWRVIEDLSLGGDPAREETLFGFVADVGVDAAGRLYVLDQQAQQVRVFDAGGATAGTIGEPGDGPGGLSRFAATLLVRGDSLLVADWGRARVHRFLTDGTFVDALLFPGAPGARSWWRVGGDGSLLYRSLTRVVTNGRWSGADALFRVGADWEAPDRVLAFTYAESDLGGPGNLKVPLVVNAPSWDVLPDGLLAWLTLDGNRVRVHGPDGALRRLIGRDAWVARPPDAVERAALVERMRDKLVMLGGDPTAVDDMEVVQPEALPVITTVRSGPDGTIWVQRMGDLALTHSMALNTPDPPTAWGGPDWDVLDREGRYLGTVRVPERFRIMRLTADALYGVRTDELGVDHVVRLRLERAGEAAR